MMISAITIIALLFDKLLGEPKNFHPLVGFGNMALWIEKKLNPSARQQSSLQILIGGLAVLGLLLLILTPVIYLSFLLSDNTLLGFLFSTLILYFCIAYRSLDEHVSRVYHAFVKQDIQQARFAVSMIVSRDSAALSEQDITTATIESALENTNDAVFAALFWFAMGGLPAVITFRLINTLDAMWGYRTPRFNYFGRVAAKTDDLLNIMPARLSAMAFALVGNTRQAFACWQQQGAIWKSPNAGIVMASGSGALNVQLGGAARYHNEIQQRPLLGIGNKPQPKDIVKALTLIRHSLWLWLAITVLLELLFTYA